MHPPKNKIWLLMSRKLSGQLTLKEEKELEELMLDDYEAMYTYEVMSSLMQSEDIPEEIINEIQFLLHSNNKDLNLSQKIQVKKLNRLYYRWGNTPFKAKQKVLAIISFAFICFTAIYFGLKYVPERPAAMSETVAPYGAKKYIVLSSDIKIWLNAGSKLIYPKLQSGKIVEVYLYGEAFFDVRHIKNRKFIIHTSSIDIQDVGTVFNVKAYPGNATTEAVLIAGSITLNIKNQSSNTILLKPDQKIIFYNNLVQNKSLNLSRKTYAIEKAVADVKSNEFSETAWLDNKLVFKNEPFQELARDMERKYNVGIIINDDEIKQHKLTGVFKDENIRQALTFLQAIEPFNYHIINNKIYINK